MKILKLAKISYTEDDENLEKLIEETLEISMKLKSIEKRLNGKENNEDHGNLNLIVVYLIKEIETKVNAYDDLYGNTEVADIE